MTAVVVAYVPVLHEGYWRFLRRHGTGRPMFVVGRELYDDDRALAKDIRRLDPALVSSAIASWGICSEVEVLTERLAHEVASWATSITLPAEDVSYRIVDRFFPRSAVRFDSVFLRWDRTRTAELLPPAPARRVTASDVMEELRLAGDAAGASSIDWWRQVGAAMRFAGGEIRTAENEHLPHSLSAYAAGDPRSNFFKGVHLELSTAMHAEARLIAGAARDGLRTAGSVLYVTDFPCPPCAKLVAAAGVTSLYYREGYAVLDGQDVLIAAGVEILEVIDGDEGSCPRDGVGS